MSRGKDLFHISRQIVILLGELNEIKEKERLSASEQNTMLVGVTAI